MAESNDLDLKVQAAAVRNVLSGRYPGVDWRRFQFHYRLYLALLLFVVIAGLPIVSFPALRGRLSTRVQTLREALGPLSIKSAPAWAKVGENRYPFPKELERPVVLRPQFTGVVDMTHLVFRATKDGAVQATTRAGGSEQIGAGSSEPAAGGEAAPEFRQGKIEQEAYDLLLNSNSTVSGMVKGSDPALRFKTWKAAKAEVDSYLVDLTFIQSADNTEAHYIWKVNLGTKQIIPESRLARTLPKP